MKKIGKKTENAVLSFQIFLKCYQSFIQKKIYKFFKNFTNFLPIFCRYTFKIIFLHLKSNSGKIKEKNRKPKQNFDFLYFCF